MAYAEKRWKGPTPWRVKYKLPNGSDTSESGFETKSAELIWGRDAGAAARAAASLRNAAARPKISPMVPPCRRAS